MTFSAHGVVRNGKIALDDKRSYDQGISKFIDGQEIVLRIESAQKHRSPNQNRYWFGVVVKLFSEHCGYDRDEMHEVLKAELLPEIKLIHDPATGEVLREVRTYGSTAGLTTVEFNDLIERAQRLGAEMGILIPDPEKAEVSA